MTDQEINIAIAEECGWRSPFHPDVMKFKQGWAMPERWWMNPDGVLSLDCDISPYCTNLNAMHEAEKTLKGRQRADYAWEVSCLFDTDDDCGLEGRFQHVNATARQRAEAFLRVKGKWKE